MNKKLVVILAIVMLIATCSVVSAGLLDSKDSNIKTHEFNYGNKATFNISDNLTDKDGAKSIMFGSGVSYDYPDGNLVCMILGIADYGGTDEVEHNQNDAYMEEIESEPTSQGYKTYIFKWDDMDQYDVYIDLDGLKISEDGFDENYKYFMGTFQTLDEAKVFVDTFKINEDATK